MSKLWLVDSFGGVGGLTAASLEEVAWCVLEYVKINRHNGTHHPGNMLGSLREASVSFATASQVISNAELDVVLEIAMEAFHWLLVEKLIAYDFSQGNGWVFVTRIGESVRSRGDFSSYAKRAYLPHDILQEKLAEVAVPPFLGGRYDAAVREAFTLLEISVRTAAKYGNERYGSAMMYDAFAAGSRDGKGAGPLTDVSLEVSERTGVANLFAGAIGYIKNPLSHRALGIDDARLAASRILLANDLMNTLSAHVQRANRA